MLKRVGGVSGCEEFEVLAEACKPIIEVLCLLGWLLRKVLNSLAGESQDCVGTAFAKNAIEFEFTVPLVESCKFLLRARAHAVDILN